MKNTPVMMQMQICTLFSPLLSWRDQLAPLLGQEEVDRLANKLKDIHINGDLNHLLLPSQSMYIYLQMVIIYRQLAYVFITRFTLCCQIERLYFM